MVRLMDQSLDSRRDSAFLVDSRSNWTLRGSWPRTLRGPKSGRLAKPRRETPTPQPGPLRNLGKYLECVFFWGDNDEKYVGSLHWCLVPMFSIWKNGDPYLFDLSPFLDQHAANQAVGHFRSLAAALKGFNMADGFSSL